MDRTDAMALLQIYGLDQLLTDRDDPCLWAAAVAKHWPRPDDPGLYEMTFGAEPRFRFGISHTADAGRKPRRTPKLVLSETWSCERVDAGHFTAIRGAPEYPHFILEISRPSAGEEKAFVHAGENPAPLVGRGWTAVWLRRADGDWAETDEVFGVWVS